MYIYFLFFKLKTYCSLKTISFSPSKFFPMLVSLALLLLLILFIFYKMSRRKRCEFCGNKVENPCQEYDSICVGGQQAMRDAGFANPLTCNHSWVKLELKQDPKNNTNVQNVTLLSGFMEHLGIITKVYLLLLLFCFFCF